MNRIPSWRGCLSEIKWRGQGLSAVPVNQRLGSRSFWTAKDIYRKQELAPRELTPTERNEELKRLLRIVPHALTVVTSKADFASAPSGLLVSSFNSVTLQPIPYVSFNIRSVSSTLAAIKKSRSFVASVIDQPYIADAFAQQLQNSEEVKANVLKSNGELKPGNGGVLWVRCRYVYRSSVEVGDHNIVVGEVLDFGAYDLKYLGHSSMVYCQGAYRRVNNSKPVGLGSSSNIWLGKDNEQTSVVRKIPMSPVRRVEK